MANTKGRRTAFGSTRKLPSGRWQARYTGPDGLTHKAHTTFDTKGDAETWLSTVRADIVRETWRPGGGPGKVRALTFGEYAEAWLTGRTVKGRQLADRTREHYRKLLDTYLLPTFGDTPLKFITPEQVDHWYAVTAVGKPTTQAHAYSLLRTILGTAVDRNLITTANPAKVRGGGSTTRVKKVKPASLAELETIARAMPERYRVMVLLASWCALRFGELAELRRGDVNTKTGVLHIRRGVVRAGGEVIVKTPKSDAGARDVAIPPHLLPLVREHLLKHAEPGKDGLLFPARGGGHLAPSSLYRVFYRAREAAGRPDLRWHDLRHTGAVLAAQTGATLAELMGRLGHSTPAAALRYQHAAAERDVEIARRLSAMVEVGE
ncbi:integrase [Nocardioides salarius]|uniref:Integrase n=1 Tax=Nocardioides salarius TaxID=374513 RepID=A0ABS2M5T2_9ACTN|nr:site-specific integrase [Nocardioides salarius]MBM7506550.1 integrase [Nocardioides salarius]